MRLPETVALQPCYGVTKTMTVAFCLLIQILGEVAAQDYERHENIEGATIYDYSPSTKLGDDAFGTVVADFGDSADGQLRCSHGGPVCMEYASGTLLAFYANTSSHNVDGWSEYAISKDRGRTWDKYHPLPYSYAAYQKDPNRPVWVEEGLVTEKGIAVLFLTQFGDGRRVGNSIARSSDHGDTWGEPVPMASEPVGYPAAVAVADASNYVLMDGLDGDHSLYVSTDDGQTWSKRSTLTLQKDAWYGAMCFMEDGRLLAGAYVSNDESHFYYCISEDEGRTWGDQQRAYLDKKVRDPELAYLDGKYYLHGRSGQSGNGRGRFVLYQSNDGIRWNNGVIISGDTGHPDGYSHNCIINQYDNGASRELMVLYSICYSPPRTSEYVFFIKPDKSYP
jgi:BNR/Asp-box repeat